MVPPVLAPRRLQHRGCLLERQGASSFEELVPGALRKGCFLTKAQLTELQKVEGFVVPKKGQGSGKNGAVVKVDLVQACLQHYFPNATDEEMAFMRNALMGGNNRAESCPDELLDAIEALDPISKEDFEDIKTACRKQKKAQMQERAAREIKTTTDADKQDQKAERAPHVKSNPKNFTPQELQKLIPGRGSLAGVYLKRLLADGRKTYQGFYPGARECWWESLSGGYGCIE